MIRQAATYLQPEPLLSEPHYVAASARRGMSMPAYAYANSNPIVYFDSNGLQTVACLENGAALICPTPDSCYCTITPRRPEKKPAPQPQPQPQVGPTCEPQTGGNGNDPCDKVASSWQLQQAGVAGQEHQVKQDTLGGTNQNLSKFEICACDDGRLVVKGKGCDGPGGEDTGYNWK